MRRQGRKRVKCTDRSLGEEGRSERDSAPRPQLCLSFCFWSEGSPLLAFLCPAWHGNRPRRLREALSHSATQRPTRPERVPKFFRNPNSKARVEVSPGRHSPLATRTRALSRPKRVSTNGFNGSAGEASGGPDWA